MWAIWENHYVHHSKDGSFAPLPEISNLHVAATEETEIETHQLDRVVSERSKR